MQYTLQQQKLLKDFYEICTAHDWTYAYSDDHRVWKKGAHRQKLLDHRFNELNGLGLGEEADAIIKEFQI